MRRGLGLLWLMPALAFVGCDDDPARASPVEWQIDLDDQDVGVHTVYMIVDFGPVPETSEASGDLPFGDGDLESSGSLVWEQGEVALCGINFRFEAGEGRLGVGDIFQTTEGCGDDPTAMQDAFDRFGMPTEGCVVATLDGVTHEYCAPLPVAQTSWRA